MKRLLFLVEGETEERFVKSVLAPHLWSFDKAPEVTQVATKRVQGRRAFRGGIASYARVVDDLRRLLASSPYAVTTLFDYYALPRDFPGLGTTANAKSSAAQLDAIAAGYASPEEIDDGPETHPSRRIELLIPAYQKPLHGPLIAEKIGVAGIRARCRHFDAWLQRLESL